MRGTEVFGGFGRDEPVERIELGHDVLLAQRLGAALDDQGIDHEIVLSNDPYVGLHPASTPHLLLVRTRDHDDVREVVHDMLGDEVHHVGARSPIPGRFRLVGAVLFAVFIAGPAIVAVVNLVRNLF